MKTYIVDAFTNELFRGNPAAVCLPETALTESVMLSIAKELNLSETAFVRRAASTDAFFIRYFSPKMEIPLCGHATLASSKVLFEAHGLASVNFITAHNIELYVRMSSERIEMTFPVYETSKADVPPALLAALGITKIKNAEYNAETKILLLEIGDHIALTNLRPDFEALYRSHDAINGVLVTAASGIDGYDFHSRYFWPWSGTNEDPVTGGTHTFLGKYWAKRLRKTKMKSFQSSARSGFMDVELVDDKLVISSQAMIVLDGELRI